MSPYLAMKKKTRHQWKFTAVQANECGPQMDSKKVCLKLLVEMDLSWLGIHLVNCHLALPHIEIRECGYVKKKQHDAWAWSIHAHIRECKLSIFVDNVQIYGIFLCFPRSNLAERSIWPASQPSRSIDNILFNLKPTCDGCQFKNKSVSPSAMITHIRE